MKFHSTLLITGKTSTGVEVPEEIVLGLGGGKKPLITVTINGYTYRAAIASRGDSYLFGVSAEVREAAGLTGGDEVDVEIELDTKPRVVDIPPELAKALAAEPKAKAAFEALSNSKKQRLTLPVEQAKTDETRERNVQKALSELRDLAADSKH
jgi:hypothetical protein